MADDPYAQYADPYAQYAVQPQQTAPQPSGFDDFLRKLAIGGRGVAEGVYGTLMLPNTIGVGMQNLMTNYIGNPIKHAINYVAGTHLKDTQPIQNETQRFSQALQDAGAYSPQTSGENYLLAGSRGVAGALTGGGALGGATSVPNTIRLGVAGTTGALSSEATRQAGGGPLLQFGAGLIGGLAPSLIENGATSLWNGANNLIRPLTSGGQQSIAADTLYGQATNPAAAEQNLLASRPIVPGSMPTSGAASGDVGVLATEKALRSRNPIPFAERMSEQNTARQSELGVLGGTPADIASAESTRDTMTAAQRQQAFANATDADISPVLNKIDTALSGPAGERDVVSKALTWLRGKLTDADGNLKTDPSRLYEIRKDINDAIAGKLGGDQSVYRYAQGQLIDVRNALDDAIGNAAPGFKGYLQSYASASKPINAMSSIQDLMARANTTQIDPTTGLPMLSSAQFGRGLNALQEDSLNGVTGPTMTRLEALRRDLQNSQAVNSPLVRAPGSDTFQNLSMNAALGGYGGPGASLLRRLSGLYSVAKSDQGITDALTEGVLNPQIGASMLRTGAQQQASRLAAERAAALGRGFSGMGAAFGTAVPYLTQ